MCKFFFRTFFKIQNFIGYFKSEARSLIEGMKRDGFNLLKAKNNRFLESDQAWPLSSEEIKTKQFLKAISPLTFREQQCLNLFKQGHTAQSTAAILKLSQRTIEHYFDNIKNKLNCHSKRELLLL